MKYELIFIMKHTFIGIIGIIGINLKGLKKSLRGPHVVK